MNKIIYIAILIIATLSACTSEEYANYGQLANFSGRIDGENTRAYDQTWEEDDCIGIIADGYSNQKYLVNTTDGSFTAQGDLYYFQDRSSVSFHAYYPYTDKLPSDGIITVSTTDQSTQKNIDYLWAEATGSVSSPDVAFTFSHRMSQLKFAFSAGQGVTDLSDLTSYTISGLKLSGTFDTSTGTASATDDATDLTISNPGTTSTLTLLTQDVSSIVLSVTLGKNEYTATLTIPNSKLVAGQGLQYNITLNKSYMTVDKASFIGAWSYSGIDIDGVANSPLTLVTADDADQYALAFKNGLFLNIWDTSTDTINTEVWSKFTADSDLKSNVCGIVYWLSTTDENPTTNDPVLKAHHPDCTHGLIVALSDANSSRCAWQDYCGDVINTDFQSVESNGVSTSQGYNTIGLTYDSGNTNTTELNYIQGYNNTYVLRRYNEYLEKNSKSNYKVKPITKIDNYATAAPKGSSGWFLPSPKELVLLVNGTTSIKYDNNNNSEDYTVMTNINTIITELSNASVTAGILKDRWYWSSSENASNPLFAYYVGFGYRNIYGIVDSYAKEYGSNNCARAVSAF